MSTRSSRRSGGGAVTLNPYTLEGKTVAELRALLVARGLPSTGAKSKLIQNLQDALLQEHASGETPEKRAGTEESGRVTGERVERIRVTSLSPKATPKGRKGARDAKASQEEEGEEEEEELSSARTRSTASKAKVAEQEPPKTTRKTPAKASPAPPSDKPAPQKAGKQTKTPSQPPDEDAPSQPTKSGRRTRQSTGGTGKEEATEKPKDLQTEAEVKKKGKKAIESQASDGHAASEKPVQRKTRRQEMVSKSGSEEVASPIRSTRASAAKQVHSSEEPACSQDEGSTDEAVNTESEPPRTRSSKRTVPEKEAEPEETSSVSPTRSKKAGTGVPQFPTSAAAVVSALLGGDVEPEQYTDSAPTTTIPPPSPPPIPPEAPTLESAETGQEEEVTPASPKKEATKRTRQSIGGSMTDPSPAQPLSEEPAPKEAASIESKKKSKKSLSKASDNGVESTSVPAVTVDEDKSETASEKEKDKAGAETEDVSGERELTLEEVEAAARSGKVRKRTPSPLPEVRPKSRRLTAKADAGLEESRTAGAQRELARLAKEESRKRAAKEAAKEPKVSQPLEKEPNVSQTTPISDKQEHEKSKKKTATEKPLKEKTAPEPISSKERLEQEEPVQRAEKEKEKVTSAKKHGEKELPESVAKSKEREERSKSHSIEPTEQLVKKKKKKHKEQEVQVLMARVASAKKAKMIMEERYKGLDFGLDKVKTEKESSPHEHATLGKAKPPTPLSKLPPGKKPSLLSPVKKKAQKTGPPKKSSFASDIPDFLKDISVPAPTAKIKKGGDRPSVPSWQTQSSLKPPSAAAPVTYSRPLSHRPSRFDIAGKPLTYPLAPPTLVTLVAAGGSQSQPPLPPPPPPPPPPIPPNVPFMPAPPMPLQLPLQQPPLPPRQWDAETVRQQMESAVAVAKARAAACRISSEIDLRSSSESVGSEERAGSSHHRRARSKSHRHSRRRRHSSTPSSSSSSSSSSETQDKAPPPIPPQPPFLHHNRCRHHSHQHRVHILVNVYVCCFHNHGTGVLETKRR